MDLRLLEGPDGNVVSLEEAKAHLRELSDDHDALIENLIKAATSHMDGAKGVLGRCLLEQRWSVSWPEFSDELFLPLAPVVSVDAVRYVDVDGAVQTVNEDVYTVLVTDGAVIQSADWPATDRRPGAVTVEFTAGYGLSADVPQPIKQAMLLLIGHWFHTREAAGASTQSSPYAVEALLLPYLFRSAG